MIEQNIKQLLFSTKQLLVWGLVAAFILPVDLVIAADTSKEAFTGNRYYNSIISDADFISVNNYSLNQIQSFLNDKNAYLKDYSENGRSAAQIIYDAAHGTGDASGTLTGIAVNTATGTVSPKVLLVTLQKEQSLITLTPADRDLNPDQYTNRLQRAMGYGCPDGSSCDSRYAGFTKQIENAAWQFRYNYERAQGNGLNDYQVNQTSSFSDNTGSYSVTFANRATASLFRYTPHVFNGNYNFWKLTNDWFGATTPAPPPPIPPSSDDTGAVSGKTYKNSFHVEGTKAEATHVFYNGKEIAGSGTTRWTLDFEPEVGNKTYTVEYRDAGGTVTASRAITVDRHKQGDINGDGKVDLLDLSLLSDQWGRGVPDGDWTNLNPDTDSEVNILDLSILAANWTG